ncbi:hypothetical protein IMG5_148920 [Ichthyophthirius multifiliis]|uniref:Uncharacterized protein n=1 Tax=Ichthyophthirius multifiliis TaxID=5932 RepID=G0QYE1_ICHMU|nr:hypothetical protein IMG5_148920 [Ichthyophthirius multifiliis]EGR29766.1 hypothetical protein IMG5_148920 [Ichthyophthirius multifiliis]|eukprot:XP_004031002.1 hypothetical protein IMG5_148920 [Ichthyophthirius multifiliis]
MINQCKEQKVYIQKDIYTEIQNQIIFQQVQAKNRIQYILQIMVQEKNLGIQKHINIFLIEKIKIQQEQLVMHLQMHIQALSNQEEMIQSPQGIQLFIFQKDIYLGKVQKQIINKKNIQKQWKKKCKHLQKFCVKDYQVIKIKIQIIFLQFKYIS